ncbi:hypothetical protein BCR44DRAFT_1510960 [Catenaria anguillulae PL171]|uniref:Uncharacterized protein n=1 Tax=Catenaria anguillulae PL171 TaxID=765915 RepID=A0A1Y2HZM4_9FUNG|nr:hypothetical protein BCR44DRAFT_1510960 [Catenaria anguillulae PL171]
MLRSTAADVIASRPGIFEADWPASPPPPPDPAPIPNAYGAEGTFANSSTLAPQQVVNGDDAVIAVSEEIDQDDEWNQIPHAAAAPADISEWAAPAPTSTRARPAANNHHRQHHRPQDDPRFRPAPLIPVTSGYASTIQPMTSLHQPNHNQNGTNPGPTHTNIIEKLASKIASVAATPATTNGNIAGVTAASHRSSPALPANVTNPPSAAATAARPNQQQRRARMRNVHQVPPPLPNRRQRVLLVLPATLAEATADMAYLVQLARSTYNDPNLTANDIDVQYAWLPPRIPGASAGAEGPTSPSPAAAKPPTIRTSKDPANHRLRLTNLLPHIADATIVRAITNHLPANIPLASYSIYPPALTKRGVYVKSIILGFHTAFQVKHAYAWLHAKCPASIEPLLIPMASGAAAATRKPEVHWLTPRPRSLTPTPTPPPPPVQPTPLPAVTLANIDATAHKDDVLDVLFGDQPLDLRPVKVERLVMPVATEPPTLALRFAFKSAELVGRFVRAVRRGVREGEYVEVTAPGLSLIVVKVEGWEDPEVEREMPDSVDGDGHDEDECEVDVDVVDGGVELQSDGGWPQFEYLGDLSAGQSVVREEVEAEEQRRGRTGTGGKWVGREVGVVG